MAKGLAAGTLLVGVIVAGAAMGAPSTFSWTGTGTNVSGSSKCVAYKMTIDVAVEGSAIKGSFQQEGRDARHFEAMADAKGMFKTKAQVGGGGSMDVTGSITDADAKVLLDGYCKFGGKLSRK